MSVNLPELDKARKQLESIKAKEARALDLYLDGTVDKDYLTLKVRELKELREYYEAELTRLEREAETVNHSIEGLNSFIKASSHIASRLDGMNDEEKAETVRLVVKKVVVRREGSYVVMALDGVIQALEGSHTSEGTVNASPCRRHSPECS